MRKLEGANNRNTELQSAIGKLEEEKVSLNTQVWIIKCETSNTIC